jgi:hypothetical protein
LIDQPSDATMPGEIYTRQILGTDVLYEIKTGDETLRAVTPTSRLLDPGMPVGIDIDWSNAFIFDRQSEFCLYPRHD